jgi:hypothetical protein
MIIEMMCAPNFFSELRNLAYCGIIIFDTEKTVTIIVQFNSSQVNITV